MSQHPRHVMKGWLRQARAGRLLIVSIVFSVLLSEALVLLLSLWRHNEVKGEYLVAGAITAAIVSFVVIILIQAVVRALQRADEQLLEQTLYLDSILQSTGDTLIIALDTGFRVKYLNSMAERVLELSARESHGRHLTDVAQRLGPEEFDQATRAVIPSHGYSFQFNCMLGSERHFFEARLTKIAHRGHAAGFLLVAHDTTERKLLEETLRDLSYQDGLTGIANRRRFDEKLEQEWRRAARDRQHLTLVMVDIDFFKNYNDLYGHPAGDECLKKIAQVMQHNAARPGDLAARYGGEEFVVVLPNTAPPGAETVGEEIRAEVAALELPHAQSSVSPWVTVSVGVATRIPVNGDSFELLIEGADRALYKAKQQGRNRVVLDQH